MTLKLLKPRCQHISQASSIFSKLALTAPIFLIWQVHYKWLRKHPTIKKNPKNEYVKSNLCSLRKREVHPPMIPISHNAIPHCVGTQEEEDKNCTAGGSLNAGEAATRRAVPHRQPDVFLRNSSLQFCHKNSREPLQLRLTWNTKHPISVYPEKVTQAT